MEKLKVFTAFSGYDSQCMALDRLNIDYNLVGWSEIDKYAIQAHNALYPQYADRNYGDISKINWVNVPDFDLFTMSSPCQDFSNAGLQRGGEEGSGTRSSLLWECRKAIEIKRPKYILFENVKALVSSKFINGFNKWQKELEQYGYTNFCQVLNAKNYGVPQNRERIFMVSIRNDIDKRYHFPEPIKLEKRLRDVLEDEVDEKYYLSDKLVESLSRDNGGYKGMIPKDKDDVACTLTARYFKMGRSDNYVTDTTICLNSKVDGKQPSLQDRVYSTEGISTALTTSFLPSVMRVGNLKEDKGFSNPQVGRVYSDEGLSPTLDTMQGGGRQPKILAMRGRSSGQELEQRKDDITNTITTVQKDNLLAEPKILFKGIVFNEGDGLYCSTSESFNRAGLSNLSRTLKASQHDACMVVDSCIRKLTPRECFRLMGVNEKDINILINSGISNSQQYKMAGNGIVVDVLVEIFRNLLIDKCEPSQPTLF